MIKLPALLLLAFLLFPQTAYAYIDPGTGALILQMLIAGVATAAITVKMWWARFLSFFRRSDEDEKSDQKGGGQDS